LKIYFKFLKFFSGFNVETVEYRNIVSKFVKYLRVTLFTALRLATKIAIRVGGVCVSPFECYFFLVARRCSKRVVRLFLSLCWVFSAIFLDLRTSKFRPFNLYDEGKFFVFLGNWMYYVINNEAILFKKK